MVATTFAADTPLVVTGLIYAQGIAGNWLWWSFLLTGMLTVFFFAPLWRRARVLTDMEFAELRYSGPPATFLRGFRATYLAFPVNTIIMGWVNLAMAKILALTLGLTTTRQQLTGVFCCLALTLAYNAVSGMWAVLWTDLVQFVLKMSMVILLAYFAVHAVGGMHSLAAHIHAFDAAHSTAAAPRDTLAFIPSSASPFFLSFLVLLSLNWWASWYPGAEPGGGGYIAQRIFSAKNEKHSLGATLWFNIAHYALRPWPWILTALVALVLLPNPTPAQGGMEGAYVWVMVHYLPPSLRGLMLAGFAAAYMSTVGTHLNLGASYMINDLYKRFFAPDKSERHYVSASRIATILVALLSATATRLHAHPWSLHRDRLEVPALARRGRRPGLHPALVLVAHQRMERNRRHDRRRYHLPYPGKQPRHAHRPRAASHRPRARPFATQSGRPARLRMAHVDHDRPHHRHLAGCHARSPSLRPRPPCKPSTTASVRRRWAGAASFSPPCCHPAAQAGSPREPSLCIAKVQAESDLLLIMPPPTHPGSPASLLAEATDPTLRYNFCHWILGFTLVYAMLFGVGDLLFGRIAPGAALLTLSAACLAILFYSLNRRGWSVWR